MINIPAALFTKYTLLLNQKTVPISVHNNYKKWLRYYLDFCHKYCHRYADRESLKHFMIKLHEKNQPLSMQEEAGKAVGFYYEMLEKTGDSPDSTAPFHSAGKSGTVPSLPVLEGDEGVVTKQSNHPCPSLSKEGSLWQNVHDGLFAEIKVRHYSQKTLRSYSI